MTIRSLAHRVAAGLLLTCAVLVPAIAQSAYVGDPDPKRPMLHVQPPVVDLKPGTVSVPAMAGTINGVYFIDVLRATGFNFAGFDYGNEPSVTANPLEPNRIVVTSFSGSNWGSGGNSTLFSSGDTGLTWTYTASVPPPTGVSSTINCPCDQTVEWGRDGILSATFLHVSSDGAVQSVYSAQATVPTSDASWIYRTVGGIADRTNLDAFVDVDQPWISGGPLDTDNSKTNACVAYDNFDSGFSNVQMRVGDSPGNYPLDFTRDVPTNADGQILNDGMNPGNRLAVGPTGVMFDLFQRYVSGGSVKTVTYVVNVSTNGGQTWGAANSDDPSGGKIVFANAMSFQGNGSKVGGVNALLGGVDAIAVDPATGTAWIVYGRRISPSGRDLLWLVPVTYSAGNLVIGTPRQISPSTTNSYLPAVAVLPNGEVGVLDLTYDGTANFAYRLVQTVDGGVSLAKMTDFASFTSPFSSGGASNQRIFGDYIQLKPVGCSFYGVYAARGSGGQTVNSIDPYFLNAPAATACSGPSLTSLVPDAVCAGSPGFNLQLIGTGFLNGATARLGGSARTTTFASGTSVSAPLLASDVASPGSVSVNLLNASPAGGLTGTVQLPVETSAASPGASLLLTKGGGLISLAWSAAAGATRYNVKRCGGPFPCTPGFISNVPSNAYSENTENDGNSYWYLIEAVNSCGAVP